MIALLKRLWNWWKPVARKIGNFQARVLLTLFYFVIFAPFALVVRLAMDPLAIKHTGEPQWKDKSKSKGDPAQQW